MLNTDDPEGAFSTLNVSVLSAKLAAGDISPDADVEILQPDYHIATMTKKDVLKIQMEIGVDGRVATGRPTARRTSSK